MFIDTRGIAASSKTLEGVRALDHAIDGYLCMAADTGDRLKAAYAEDSSDAHGRYPTRYFFMLMAIPALKVKAGELRGGLDDRWSDMTQRERLHAMPCMPGQKASRTKP